MFSQSNNLFFFTCAMGEDTQSMEVYCVGRNGQNVCGCRWEWNRHIKGKSGNGQKSSGRGVKKTPAQGSLAQQAEWKSGRKAIQNSSEKETFSFSV